MNDFYELGTECGTDKVTHHGYHYFYPKHLEAFRNEEFQLFEIGYDTGNSCRLWEKYFPNATIFAMDVNVEGKFGNHTVFRGDQSNERDLREIISRIGGARLIVDDGSHNPTHQIETFNMLFRDLLEPGGVYIIEDIECSYWRENSSLYGYRVGVFNAVDHTKKLIDGINCEFTNTSNRLGISSITYGQNCIIITKQTEEEREYFNREYRFKMYC